ncbi:hypothetical protein H9Y04_45225 [Streptomyces sp. TRM66268-LWL]|uniref:Uncharacterized protein n=1 Tax=Streptomyces polyasparticus TaxID=2767826 RepID=A0ABR7SYG2_9ACTN|nr:hypothetical protein [Streptomyces polyasparticus]MBC9719682.1 hypothetical protein [Streptomyces polyasparticus]
MSTLLALRAPFAQLPSGLIGLVLFTLLACWGAWALASTRGFQRGAETLLMWTVLLAGHIMTVTLFVGAALQSLDAGTLTVVNAMLVVAEVGYARLPAPRARARQARESVRRALGYMPRNVLRHPATLALAAMVAVQYTVRALMGARLPLRDWDGLAYHLNGPDNWLFNHAIGHTPQNLFSDVYPLGQGLLTAWTGAFLGSYQGLWAVQFLFSTMLLLATACLALRCGARPAHAVFAGLGMLAVPIVFLQTDTAYVDVANAATCMATLAVLFTIQPQEVASYSALRARMFALGVSAGCAASVKTAGLLVVAVAAVAGIVQLVRCWPAPDRAPQLGGGLRQAIVVACAGLAPICALSAFWYARTWSTYGSPFWPVAMWGFPGMGPVETIIIGANEPLELREQPALVMKLLITWFSDVVPHTYRYDQALGGFGAVWPLLLLPAVLVAAWLGVRRRLPTAVPLLVLAISIISFANPAPWWSRFTIPLVGLGFICLAVLLGMTSMRWLRLALPAVAVGLIGMSMFQASGQPNVAVADGKGGWDNLSFRETASLTLKGKNPGELVWPAAAYRGLDSLPQGSIVGVTGLGSNVEQPYTHVYASDNFTRRLEVLGAQSSPAALLQRAKARSVRYVFLQAKGPDVALSAQVARDRRHFRRLHLEPSPSETVYEIGLFNPPKCPGGARLRLVPPERADRVVRIDGTVRDGCGAPYRDALVEIWVSFANGSVWEGGTLLASRAVAADAKATFELPPDTRERRVFLRTGSGGYLPPAASNTVLIPGRPGPQ